MELTSTLEPVRATALLLILGAAAWQDVRTRRISNRVTVPGLLLGLGLAAGTGSPPFGSALAASALALALGMPLFATRVVGGGDVKLLAAGASFLGLQGLPAALLITALAGGAIGLVQAARHGVLLPALLDSRDLLVRWAGVSGRGGRAAAAGPRLTVPYGLAISIGMWGAWLAR